MNFPLLVTKRKIYTKLGEFCSLRGLVEEAGERRKGGGRGRRRKEREGKKKERKG